MCVHPIVMTQELVNSVGHNVMLGQGYVRPCLGMADPLTERFYFSPAWAKHGCRDFRVSVPCTMLKTAPDASAVAGICFTSNYYERIEDCMDYATCAVTLKQPRKPETKVVAATPLAPGFPQTNPPTRTEWNQHRQREAHRNIKTWQRAHELLPVAQSKAADDLACIAAPIGVVYPMTTLKQSGRLMDGMRLDLSGASSTVVQHLERLKANIVSDVVKQLEGRSPSQATPVTGNASQATAPVTAENPAPSPVPAHAVDSDSDAPPPVIVRHVNVAQVATGHLPYELPAQWSAHSGVSQEALVASVNQRTAPVHQKRQFPKRSTSTVPRNLKGAAASAVLAALSSTLIACQSPTTSRSYP